MNKTLDDALCKDFPNMYRDRHAGMNATCMCWGFSCGDGWEPLIRECSRIIESEIIRVKNEYPDCEYLPRASQIKEKFGTLRIYMSSSTDIMDWAIRKASRKSAYTCETCGKPGILRGGWIYCSCLAHAHEEDLRSAEKIIRDMPFNDMIYSWYVKYRAVVRRIMWSKEEIAYKWHKVKRWITQDATTR